MVRALIGDMFARPTGTAPQNRATVRTAFALRTLAALPTLIVLRMSIVESLGSAYLKPSVRATLTASVMATSATTTTFVSRVQGATSTTTVTPTAQTSPMSYAWAVLSVSKAFAAQKQDARLTLGALLTSSATIADSVKTMTVACRTLTAL